MVFFNISLIISDVEHFSCTKEPLPDLFHQISVLPITEFHINPISIAHILFFSFIFISWRLITLQYCSGFCHTLT